MTRRWPQAPLLRVGDRFHLDASVVEVVRVNDCAAYVRSERTRAVTVRNPDGTERTFEARESAVVAVSPRAIVKLC